MKTNAVVCDATHTLVAKLVRFQRLRSTTTTSQSRVEQTQLAQDHTAFPQRARALFVRVIKWCSVLVIVFLAWTHDYENSFLIGCYVCSNAHR